MNIKQIKALAQVLEASDLSVIEVVEGENKIRLERTVTASAAAAAPAAPAIPAAEPAPAATVSGVVDFNDVNAVKSPMVGVFYATPSPDAEPFVQIGSKVKKGDVLCIIEAMKLMNDIVADRDGEIVDICAQNGQVVEYGQPLFKIF